MENDVLHGKDPFPKSVADACRILARLKNTYGNNDSRLTEANDGVAFATINNDEKKCNKKKYVTCYECATKWDTIPTNVMKKRPSKCPTRREPTYWYTMHIRTTVAQGKSLNMELTQSRHIQILVL